MPDTARKVRNTLLLLLAALIWGFAFSAQSIGAQHLGTFTFQTCRSWLAVLFLLPVTAAADRVRAKMGLPAGKPQAPEARRTLCVGGILCGVLLFAAASVQQAGIGLTTTARSGFITALYVIIVPLLSLVSGRKPAPVLWACIVLALAGLRLLCGDFGTGLGTGDLLILACAFLFSFQILAIEHYAPRTDGIRLSLLQMLTAAVLSTVCMLLFERPDTASLRAAAGALLYAGIFSGGVAYTLQIIGEDGLDPSIASMAMCMESVFSALGGCIFLGQTLSAREFMGCALMFGAVMLAQLPIRRRTA